MQKKLGWMLGILLSISAMTSTAWAENSEDHLAEIRFIEGNWIAQRYLLGADQNWVATQSSALSFQRKYGTNYLQATLDQPQAQWQIILGRDPKEGRYRMVSMSADNGQLAVFEGHYSKAGGLMLDNAATNTAFEGPKGRYYLRYLFESTDKNKVTLTTSRAEAREMEWRPVSRVVFTRP